MSTQEESNPLPGLYFKWLYDQVVPTRELNGLSSYWKVCTIMHSVVFLDLVEHDSNRIADGANLRNEFLAQSGGQILDKNDVMFPDATIFEVLVALAIRANLMIEMDVMKWFQLFLSNLRLDRYNDWYCMMHHIGGITRNLNRFNKRIYRPDGSAGGLFPLARPTKDQREVELWYQMGAYMNENMMERDAQGR